MTAVAIVAHAMGWPAQDEVEAKGADTNRQACESLVVSQLRANDEAMSDCRRSSSPRLTEWQESREEADWCVRVTGMARRTPDQDRHVTTSSASTELESHPYFAGIGYYNASAGLTQGEVIIMIRIGFRRRSLLRWVGYHFIADPTLPNVFASSDDEACLVASIQNTIDSTLAEQKAVPNWVPKDIRIALHKTNLARRPVLQRAARRLGKATVYKEAIQIASGRASYRWNGRVGISASILAGAIVTATPFINYFRPDVTPPDCAPDRPKNRHIRRKQSATAAKSAPVRSPKPAADRLASIKRSPLARKG